MKKQYNDNLVAGAAIRDGRGRKIAERFDSHEEELGNLSDRITEQDAKFSAQDSKINEGITRTQQYASSIDSSLNEIKGSGDIPAATIAQVAENTAKLVKSVLVLLSLL